MLFSSAEVCDNPKENWLSDGSWEFTAEVPAGLVTEFFHKLAQITKGNVQTAILERHE